MVHLFLMALYESEPHFHKQVRHCGYDLDNDYKPEIIPKRQQTGTIFPFIKWLVGWRIPAGANLSELEKIRLNIGILPYDTFGKQPQQEWRCPACDYHCMNAYGGWELKHLAL